MHDRLLFTVLFLIGWIFGVAAQSPGLQPDRLFLKDGSVVEGSFIEHTESDWFIFRLTDGEEWAVDGDKVDRLVLAPSPRSEEVFDRMVMINGTSFDGTIGGSDEAGGVKLILDGGALLVFRLTEVRSIERGIPKVKALREAAATRDTAAIDRLYQFREKGIYNATYFAGLNGKTSRSFQLGLGLHTVTGYQFHRLFGLGIGIGMDAYSFDRSEIILPVFAEIRGYLTRSRTSPYYSLNAGYGFAFTNENKLITDAEGGAMFHPAVGFRFGAQPDINVVMDLGYRFQWASYRQEFSFSGDIEYRDLLYKRLTFRLGLLF